MHEKSAFILWKNKKNIINLSFADFAHIVVTLKLTE